MSTFLILLLLISPLSVISSNLHTVLSPFSVNPSVEVFSSPVTKVETISLSPTYTKAVNVPSAAAVAYASTGTPVVQRIESYSSGDSSNSEIRDLLRSLLSELRSSKSAQVLSAPLTSLSSSYGAPPSPSPVRSSYGAPAPLRSSYGPPPSDSYGAPPSDSYGAPPRNTYTDSSAQSYPDSTRSQKPEKVVVLQERQPAAYVSAPAAAAVATIQTRAPAVKEVVRTVYQPVYLPVQYSQPEVQYQLSQPVTQSVPVYSGVPTSINTGVSAVAYSTVHSRPAFAIQQQYSLPTVVQQEVQQFATLQSGGTAAAAAVLDGSSSGGYKK